MPYIIINDKNPEFPPCYYRGDGFGSAEVAVTADDAVTFATLTLASAFMQSRPDKPQLYALGWRIVPVL